MATGQSCGRKYAKHSSSESPNKGGTGCALLFGVGLLILGVVVFASSLGVF